MKHQFATYAAHDGAHKRVQVAQEGALDGAMDDAQVGVQKGAQEGATDDAQVAHMRAHNIALKRAPVIVVLFWKWLQFPILSREKALLNT